MSTWTQQHRAWLRAQAWRRRASNAAGPSRRDRHARAAPRGTGEDDRRARARLAVRADRRPVALPARVDTLSAVGLAAEIGDFERFDAAREADELPRPRPLGEQHRRDPPAGHRSRRPAPVTPAGYSSRPAGTTASSPPAASHCNAARTDNLPTSSDLLARATTPAPRLATPRRPNAASGARSSPSRSPANSPASAGHSLAPTDPAAPDPRHVGREGRQEPANAREHQRSNYEQPAQRR